MELGCSLPTLKKGDYPGLSWSAEPKHMSLLRVEEIDKRVNHRDDIEEEGREIPNRRGTHPPSWP